jgi:hypothetical protein
MTRLVMAIAATVALLGAAVPARAQSTTDPIGHVNAPEVFATVGYWRLGSDEGAIGHGPSYGGGLTVPVWRSLALAVDVQTGAVVKPAAAWHPWEYRTRRTLIVPSLVYRVGTRRGYGFVGGGVGVELERSRTRHAGRPPSGQGWREVAPGVFDLHQSDAGRRLSAAAGFAGFPTPGIGVRAEVFIASWHLGTRLSVAYRFD